MTRPLDEGMMLRRVKSAVGGRIIRLHRAASLGQDAWNSTSAEFAALGISLRAGWLAGRTVTGIAMASKSTKNVVVREVW
jgi:hypothetical protein